MDDIKPGKNQTQKQKKAPIPIEAPKQDIGKVLYSWKMKEFEDHERTMVWYTVAGVVAVIFLIWSLLDANYLFSIIIIIVAITYSLQMNRKPRIIDAKITDKGIVLGEHLYRYDSMRAFWVIYKPPDVNTLYADFKSAIRTELSIPLGRKNPIKIREILLDYLEEDLEKEDETSTDYLRRTLKL